jgi:hypothetical protein
MLRKWYRSPLFRHHLLMLWFWVVVGASLSGLLTAAWRIDRGVRRRGSRVLHHSDVWRDVRDRGVRRRGSRVLHHSDVWRDVRDSRRDAEATSVFSNDVSWSSWSRRNRR